MGVIARRFIGVLTLLTATVLSGQSQAAVATAINCSQFTHKSMLLIGLDDLLVPISGQDKTPVGTCYLSDFDGDGVLDLLVQGATSADRTAIY